MAGAGSLAKKVGGPQRVEKPRPVESPDPYEMANLYPRETGLPVTVWVSPRGKARHAARIKVCLRPGDRMVPSNTASVRILPEPKLVEGELKADYLDQVSRWIASNRDALIDYWNGAIGTSELTARLKRLGPAGTPDQPPTRP